VKCLRFAGWLFRWAAVCCAAIVCAAASAQTDARLRSGASVNLGSQWLSADERRFVEHLPEVRIAVSRSGGPPYEVVGADGEISGIQAETFSALAAAIGLKVKPLIFETWPEVLAALRDGRTDMILTIAPTPERRKSMAFTLGVVPVPRGVFGRAGSQRAPLQRARFALEREFASVETLQRRYPDASISLYSGTAAALREVSEGRADYYVGSLLEVVDVLSRAPLQGIELVEMMQVGTGHYHFAVRSDWQPLVSILNRAVAGTRAEPPKSLTDAVSDAVRALRPVAQWLPLSPLSTQEQTLLHRQPVWRVGAVRGLPLLNDVDARGQHSGVAADYVEQVAARLGVGTEIVGFDNVAAMLEALRAGTIDLVPFLTRTPQRERDFRFSQPYIEMPYVMVGRGDGPLYYDLGSLRGRRLALALEHPLRPLLAERFPTIQIVDAANGNEAMDRVVRGEADAAVEIKPFANLRLNADGGVNLRLLSRVVELPAQFHFAAPPQAEPLLALVDRAIDSLPADERERMLRRWIAVDLFPGFPWRRWLPLIAVSAAALLLLTAGTLWSNRRLKREAAARQRVVEQLDDIGRALPAVTFRYLCDDQGRVSETWTSPGAEAFFGVPLRPHALIEESLGDRISPQDLQRLREDQRRAVETLQPSRTENTYCHPDGRELRLRVEVVHSRVTEGLHAWTGVVTDITPEHKLQQQVADEAHQRYVLLASASHELRAPTHVLSLALQSLPEATLPAEASGKLRIARDAARTLVQLLDDVLDAARITAGRVELRPQTFALDALLQQLAEAHAGAAQAKGLGFSWRMADDVPRSIRADPLRLKQVLTNLLSNAIKYTDHGSVVIEVGRGVQAGAPALRFVVEDSGVGIGPEQQQRLFEPFAAANPAAGARSTGLGLSVCRRLVALMGGHLTIRSEPGRGTRAVAVVPLAVSHRATGARLPAGSGLLVCDDDATSRVLLAELLRARGHVVKEASSAAQALQLWREGDVRLIVTDLNMPHETGADLIAAVRTDEQRTGRGEYTPIVACSGDPAPPHGERAQSWDAYLSKPVDVRTLEDTLAELGIEPP
jgi:two-component system, NarL family, sensor histidine kinase EvgS